jgi:hypothetical protein
LGKFIGAMVDATGTSSIRVITENFSDKTNS